MNKAINVAIKAVFKPCIVITLITLGFPVAAANAQDGLVLYEKPVLVIDPGMHTAIIWPADIDADGRFAVTGSDDKTLRVWSLQPLQLDLTIRIPSGNGNVGKIYAAAISPDGQLIAAGGWTYGETGREKIYLFQRTGEFLGFISGLPNVVFNLSFSHDGRFLVAGFGRAYGIRIYSRDSGWQEVARDDDYGSEVYGFDFDGEGRLATTSYDGHVRLYDRTFNLIGKHKTATGSRPYSIAFSPDGKRLAVGFDDTPSVSLLNGLTLNPLVAPEVSGIDNGNLARVAWSHDGQTLYATGWFNVDDASPVVAWSEAGYGERRFLYLGTRTTIFSINPLPNSRVLVAAGDPLLGIFTPDGVMGEVVASPKFDPRGQRHSLSVSNDGTIVDFGFEYQGAGPARFDLRALKLLASERPNDGLTSSPRQVGLEIENWVNSESPSFNGKVLPLKPRESSRSLAIHPDSKSFLLGTDWALRAYDADGFELWQRATPSIAWAVNISGDGRLAIAAYHDGTIRWHRMDDGRELLAFFPMINRTDWVAWTPEGFYAASEGARDVLRWHVNRGLDKAPETYPVSKFPQLERPGALALVLQELETARALGIDDLRLARTEVQQITGSKFPPGARLHVLTIGVSDYGANASHLALKFADDDARDLANALLNSQTGLYSDVLVQPLLDNDATKDGIYSALKLMEGAMARGEGNDVAVILFSGHGGLFGSPGSQKFYLLPHDVDPRLGGIPLKAIPISEFQAHLAPLAHRGQVIVLLDACRAGAAHGNGAALTYNADALRMGLASSNISVFTSSRGTQPSREHDDWSNGAFTESLLEAIGTPADSNGDKLLSLSELGRYMAPRISEITENKQELGVEIRHLYDVLGTN